MLTRADALLRALERRATGTAARRAAYTQRRYEERVALGGAALDEQSLTALFFRKLGLGLGLGLLCIRQ